jgi:uncharacterized protein YoxC
MTDFNQVLEEAIAATLILLARAGEAEDGLKDLEDASDNAGALADEADLPHESLTEAASACHQAQESVETTTLHTRESLHALTDQVGVLEGHVHDFVVKVEDGLAQLAQRREHLRTTVDDAIHDVEEGLAKLGGDVHAFKDRIETALGNAEGHVTQLRQAIAHTEERLQDQHTLLHGILDDVRTSGHANADHTAQAAAALLASMGQHAVDLCNRAITAHNNAFRWLRSGLTDEQPGGGQPSDTWIERALKPVHEAVAEFALVREPTASLVADSVAASIQRAETALNTLVDISHTLRSATAALAT